MTLSNIHEQNIDININKIFLVNDFCTLSKLDLDIWFCYGSFLVTRKKLIKCFVKWIQSKVNIEMMV